MYRNLFTNDYDETENELIALRRKIHRIAETGGNEFKTRELILDEAGRLGLPYIKLEGTGCIVILDTGRKGGKIGLRADMDALPMPESLRNLKADKPCISENPATCHACGHDAHTAMMIAAMKILYSLKDRLSGTIYFCFEQGEENRSGYAAMLSKMLELGLDTVYGMHVDSQIESGLIYIPEGVCTTGIVPISFKITGSGGHSSNPSACKNPLMPACEFVQSVYTAIYNGLPKSNTASMAVTTLHCGTARNIIAEEALVEGSIRYLEPRDGEKAKEIVKREAHYTAEKHGCHAEFDPIMDSGYIPVFNDPVCTARARSAAAEEFGEGNILCDTKSTGMASESFGYYTRHFPGVFVMLGTGNSAKGTNAVHHNPQFDIDEDMLIRGARMTVMYAVKYLEEKNENH